LSDASPLLHNAQRGKRALVGGWQSPLPYQRLHSLYHAERELSEIDAALTGFAAIIDGYLPAA